MTSCHHHLRSSCPLAAVYRSYMETLLPILVSLAGRTNLHLGRKWEESATEFTVGMSCRKVLGTVRKRYESGTRVALWKSKREASLLLYQTSRLTPVFVLGQVYTSRGAHQGDGLPVGVKREAGRGGLPDLAGDDHFRRCEQGEAHTQEFLLSFCLSKKASIRF